tara:strand:+ start:241 stop:477 length:237 start_codon:yes stop_codon:yes gene_type:complete
MPQIGWFEILIVVILAIVIIGPKDFPIVVKKIGSWVASLKNYFNEVQKDISEIENSVEDELSLKNNISDLTDNKNKDE